jgi:gas vesicle protein
MIIRGFAALVISAVLGIGTLIVVNNASNDANTTAKEITRQSLEYQKQATKDAADQSKQIQDSVNESVEQATQDNGADAEQIQKDVDAQIDAATDAIADATK